LVKLEVLQYYQLTAHRVVEPFASLREVAMRSQLSYFLRFSLALLIIGLFIGVPNVKASGTASYEVRCPDIHVWGTTDAPLPPSVISAPNIVLWYSNLTTGITSVGVIGVTPSSTGYTFDETIDFSGAVRPGDELRIRILDNDGDLLDVTFTVRCGARKPDLPPVTRLAYEARIIHCNMPILQGPAGPPLSNFKVSDGEKRFVLPKPVPGKDGQL